MDAAKTRNTLVQRMGVKDAFTVEIFAIRF